MNKKTDYPDLERLPNTSFFGHFLNWVWNKPRWIVEELYEKYFLTTKKELLKKEVELMMLRNKVQQLEIENNINKIVEEHENVAKFPTETTK